MEQPLYLNVLLERLMGIRGQTQKIALEMGIENNQKQTAGYLLQKLRFRGEELGEKGSKLKALISLYTSLQINTNQIIHRARQFCVFVCKP